MVETLLPYLQNATYSSQASNLLHRQCWLLGTLAHHVAAMTLHTPPLIERDILVAVTNLSPGNVGFQGH